MPLKRFALLTSSHEGSALAQRAQREGLDVLTGVLQDWSETYTPEEAKQDKAKEEPLEKERRLKTFSGIVPQVTPQKLIKAMSKLSDEDKAETFIMVDMNYNFKYAEDLAALGIPGNYPTVDDRILESDREAGKEFVKENFKDLKLTEVHDFNSVQDALTFLEENMQNGDEAKLWVLKGNDAGAETIVPLNDDTAEQAYQTIKTALDKDSQTYEGKGFILEEFIKDAIEITPQCVFYDGKPLIYSCDIEIKKKGSGLSGRTTGCAANLVFRTNPEDPINQMAFPPIIYEMAKARKGLFIWDASVLCNPETNEYFFGEFCCNRWGFDCTQTEMCMAGGVKSYFEKIIAGEAPYEFGKFGFAVRIFNEIDDKDVPAHSAADVPFFVDTEVENYVWPLYVYKDDEGMKSSGYGEDLAVVTCVADSIESAATGCYEYMKKIGFKDYSRLSLDDIFSTRSAGTILNRFVYGNGKLYNVINGEQLNVAKDVAKDVEKTGNNYQLEETPKVPKIMQYFGEMLQQTDSLQKSFETKTKELADQYQQKLTVEVETLRTLMTSMVAKTSQKDSKLIDTVIGQMQMILQEFRIGIETMQSLNNRVADMGMINNSLLVIQQGLKPLEKADYWIKTSDRLGSVEVLLSELIKVSKQPKVDTTGAQMERLFGELKKTLIEQSDREIKANKETVTVVGSGRPSRQGLINVAFDSVDVVYPTGTTEVYTFKIGTNSPNGTGHVIAVITVVYTDSTKNSILSVRKV